MRSVGPRNGKTLLHVPSQARRTCRSFRCPLPSSSRRIVGVGASRVRDLFKKAKDASPAIVFITSSIRSAGRGGGQVGGGGGDEREQVEPDPHRDGGFDPSTAVIVIAATNRPTSSTQRCFAWPLRPARCRAAS